MWLHLLFVLIKLVDDKISFTNTLSLYILGSTGNRKGQQEQERKQILRID